MKTLLTKVVAKLNNATVHATHTAIKGKKSGGTADSSSYQHWQKNTSGGHDSVN